MRKLAGPESNYYPLTMQCNKSWGQQSREPTHFCQKIYLSEEESVLCRTALHWCCDRGFEAQAEMLMAKGADVNAVTKVNLLS